jgi:hypothetical protein
MATARRQLGYVSSLTTQLVGGAATLDVEFLLRRWRWWWRSCVRSVSGGGGAVLAFVTGTGIIGKDTYTVKVGASGGTARCKRFWHRTKRQSAYCVHFINSANGGGGGAGSANVADLGQNGGFGWRWQVLLVLLVAQGVSGEGNAGGNGCR